MVPFTLCSNRYKSFTVQDSQDPLRFETSPLQERRTPRGRKQHLPSYLNLSFPSALSDTHNLSFFYFRVLRVILFSSVFCSLSHVLDPVHLCGRVLRHQQSLYRLCRVRRWTLVPGSCLQLHLFSVLYVACYPYAVERTFFLSVLLPIHIFL